MVCKKRTEIPKKMKYEVRKAAYFGCVRCGCPIIHHHHIVPWHIVEKHEIENLVALCPTCHTKIHAGSYTNEKLLEDIRNPFNKRHGKIIDNFYLNKLADITLILGGSSFSNIEDVITVSGQRLVYFNVDDQGRALLNAWFYDIKGNLVARVVDNEWITFLRPEIWDVVYTGGKLSINSKENSVFLELETKGSTLVINANMYYRGCTIKADSEKIILDTPTMKGIEFRNMNITGCKSGIVIGE